MRAAHQLLDHPRILEDAVVLRLIGAEQEAALRANPQVLDRPELRPLRVSIAVRSRYAEDSLRETVRRGVRQYVILGAGLDSFAYRNPFPPANLHVYEVDHPDTQTWKRQRLRDAGIELPQSLTFVPVDFERQTLADAMATGGFDIRRSLAATRSTTTCCAASWSAARVAGACRRCGSGAHPTTNTSSTAAGGWIRPPLGGPSAAGRGGCGKSISTRPCGRNSSGGSRLIPPRSSVRARASFQAEPR
jgi:hypothetical protein